MQDHGGEKPSAFEASALLPRDSPPADVAVCSSVDISQRHSSSVQQVEKESFRQDHDGPCSLNLNDSDQDEVPGHHTFSVDGAVFDQKAVLRKVDSHILPFFFSMSLLCSIDRANLSYAALQLNHDLHFSQTVYGFGSGLFFLGYMVLQVPSAYVCARVGAPRFLGMILVAWGVVATLFAWMQTGTHFYVLRLILGLAESGAYPGMWYLMARFYNDHELGVAYATVTTATAVAMVLGGPIAAGLLMLDGLGGLHGWQWLFLLEGVPPVALGIAIWCLLADSPERAAFLDPEERQWLVDRKTKQPQTESVPQEEQQVDERLVNSKFAEAQQTKPFYQSWCMWYLGIVFALVVTAGDGIVFWAPIFIHNMFDTDAPSGTAGATEAVQESGASIWATVQAALLSAIPFGFASISMLVVAQMAKRAQERHWHGAAMMFLGALSLALMAAFIGHVGWAAIICLSLAAAGIWSTQGPLLSWPATILQGTNAAAGFALMKMLACVGSFCGPFLIGALSDANKGSFVPALLLLSGLLLLASIMNLFFKEPGSSQSFLPRFPYSCGALMKRSRSDPSTITLSPTLCHILGTREDTFKDWIGRAEASEGMSIQQMQQRWRPDLAPVEERPAGHLHGEDSVVGKAQPASKRGECQFFAFI